MAWFSLEKTACYKPTTVNHEYLHDRGSLSERVPVQKTFPSVALMYRGNHPIDRSHYLDVVSHQSIRGQNERRDSL